MEKVLIVDDIEDNRVLLKSIISLDFNVVIEEAVNGQQAVELAQESTYDIILMDVSMPVLNGYDAAKQIKSLNNNAHSNIIFITAHEQEKGNIKNALDSGGIDFIEKPIDVHQLKKLVALYLRFIRKEKKYLEKLTLTNKDLNDEIIARKKYEYQFIKSQESFKNIVGKSEAAILIIDDDGILKFMNKSAETIFGRSSKELIGESFGYFMQFDSKAEINILRGDGKVGVGEVTSTKTNWEDKPAWLVLINDITTHKELQEKLLKAKEKAQESDRLKSAFLSNMSHEIRTPMNGILGFLDFIDIEEDKEKRKYFTNIIRSCGDHLLNLINDIIDISKIEAGQLDITLGECNVENLIVNAYRFFKKNPILLDKKLDLQIECVGDKELVINSDPYRINQILINLIGNAIKFTEKGNIKFGYRNKGDFLEFFVSDTGEGIPKDMLEKVFKRFSQVKDKDSTYTQGTGLGLAISKSLVELLGGEIWLHSEINVGTTFYFTIPNTKYENHLTLKLKADDDTIPINGLEDKTVLVVEDEEFNYRLIDTILQMEGVKILWAKNGFEAVELFKSDSPDIILMDIKMPGMNGLEATKIIKELSAGIPIIAQTAYALEGEKKKCLDAGCDAYISKPIKRKELLMQLSKCIVQ